VYDNESRQNITLKRFIFFWGGGKEGFHAITIGKWSWYLINNKKRVSSKWYVEVASMHLCIINLLSLILVDKNV